MRENGYAKVEGPKVSRVMQTMCLTLGRETMASKRKAPEPADDDQAELAQREKRKEKSFLSIGQHASISRRHVDLVYDFHKRRWALLCLGRNGVYVDNVFVNQVPLPTTRLPPHALLALLLFRVSRQTVCLCFVGWLFEDGGLLVRVPRDFGWVVVGTGRRTRAAAKQVKNRGAQCASARLHMPPPTGSGRDSTATANRVAQGLDRTGDG